MDLGDHSYFGYIVVEGIDEFYESVQAKKGEMIKTLRNEPWACGEFGLRTRDGHRLMFGAPVASI